jgi:glutathione synthase/RimK-type ligase-like ATP-grasp enzyme
MTPGIIGPPTDSQVERVAACLRDRGFEPVILDFSGFPGSARMSMVDGIPSVPGVEIHAVTGWYVRSLPLPLPFQPLDEHDGDGTADAAHVVARSRHAYAAGRERRSFVFSFVRALERAGSVLVNPPDRMSQHFLKIDQLEQLRRAAVPIPRTLATNDGEAVLDFARSSTGPVVYKPLAGGGLCRRVTEDDLRPERLRLLAGAPVLFQEEVPGRNIRVYVVGDRVVASYEIVSEELDYRGAETAVLQTALTDEEAQASLRAACACGMTFTGIDIRRRPEGDIAVLECNPSPMFSGIETMTGDAPVSRALAQLLTA